MTKIQEMLFQNQDLKYKEFHAKLMPTINPESIIGVRTPVIRTLAKDLFKNNFELVNNFFLELPHKYYEENNLHAFLIEQIKDFSECVLQTQKFLPFIDNWATCDSFKPKTFKKNLPQLLELSKTWIKSSHTYTCRFGMGCFMNYFLDDQFSPDYFDLILSIKNNDYYIKMMKAWYFATALAKQWSDTIPYIEQRMLPADVHKKTIRKAIESYRITAEQKAHLRQLS